MNDAQPLDSVKDHDPPPQGPRRFFGVAIAIGAGLLLVLLLVVWMVVRRSAAEQEVAPLVEVEVAPAERREIRQYVEGGGALNALPGHEAGFSAATAGKV